MELVVYLIIVVIVMMVRASSNSKNANQKRQGPAAQNRQAPVRNAKPAQKPLTQDEIRKAAELLMKKQQPKPAQPTVKAKTPKVTPQPAASFETHEPEGEGFFQGMSFGDEGIDPCHDEMYEQRTPLADPADPAPAFQLQFTPNSVMNGVIMSEVLNRRV